MIPKILYRNARQFFLGIFSDLLCVEVFLKPIERELVVALHFMLACQKEELYNILCNTNRHNYLNLNFLINKCHFHNCLNHTFRFSHKMCQIIKINNNSSYVVIHLFMHPGILEYSIKNV